MTQPPIPAAYTQMSGDELHALIVKNKAILADKLIILGHHYQRDEIICHADYRGDSFKLCLDAQRCPTVEYIVFCGVHFMAESADILTPEHQKVMLPNLTAGCSMADMANIHQVQKAWDELSASIPNSRILPITYVNSSAVLKSFVGEHGGSACTSSNAASVITWALENGEKLLFFPDQHLGRNTSVKLGLDPEKDMTVWDPHLPLGGNTVEKINNSRVILWRGHCSTHMRFNVEQIELARKDHPGIQVIVHPECTLETVKASDFSGSTEMIIKMVKQSAAGSKWAIGTEINLVKRLASENPDKYVMCLDPIECPCATMYRIHPSYLAWVLDNLVEGNIVNQIKVPGNIASTARLALDRMLELV